MDDYMDGVLWRILWKIADSVELTFLWLVFSLPIITIGASTTALYSCALNVAERKEGKLHRDFLCAFHKHFKQATVAWLATVAVILLGILDVYICLRWDSIIATGILGVLAIITIALFFILLYLPALIVWCKEPLPRLVIMAFYLSVRYFPVTVGMLSAWVVIFLAAMGISNVFWVLSAGLSALLCAYMLLPVFRAKDIKPVE